MFGANEGYNQLPVHSTTDLQAESDGNKPEVSYPLTYSSRRYTSRERVLLIALILQSLILVGLLFLIQRSYSSSSNSEYHRLYSPATQFLREEIRVFNTGLNGDTTIYQGVGDAVDQAWEGLYLNTTLRLPKSEAIQLPNKTWPIESDPGYYIAGIDVFHQLHCLNNLRKLLVDPSHTMHHDDLEHENEHTSHCIDSLRQYLMCNIDVSVLVWQWDESKNGVSTKFNYPRKCYNFEAIQEYARANQIKHYISSGVFLDDGLSDPPIIHGP